MIRMGRALSGILAIVGSLALVGLGWVLPHPAPAPGPAPPASMVAADTSTAPGMDTVVAQTVGPSCVAGSRPEECGGPGADCGCTTITVGKAASADGSVITSHTCDGWYDSGLKVIAAGDHKPGTMVSIEKNMLHADQMKPEKVGEIPQVRHTYQYFISAIRSAMSTRC